MKIEHEGLSFVLASEYRNRIQAPGGVAVLLIAAEANQLRMAESLLAMKGDLDVCIIPVSDEDAHLVDVIRVPRLRIFVDGTLKHDCLLNKDDISSLETALRRLSLF